MEGKTAPTEHLPLAIRASAVHPAPHTHQDLAWLQGHRWLPQGPCPRDSDHQHLGQTSSTMETRAASPSFLGWGTLGGKLVWTGATEPQPPPGRITNKTGGRPSTGPGSHRQPLQA